MARTIADINRMCSPMHYIEENLDENREKLREKKRQLEEAQKSKSPFLIGSIEEVNRRISNLDKQLQSYTELVIESRASGKQMLSDDDSYVPPSSAKLRDSLQRKEKETREVNCFAGIYTIKATFLDKSSDRVKQISKISMHPSKTSMKKDSGKPKFVELHQYPGYKAAELTPLPNDVTAVEILSKVTSAQPNLKHLQKSLYRPEFEHLFYSAMSQSVLQDAFWWVFLEKWQPNASSQQKLFNRISHNYVKLMMYARHPQYKETFFRDYPSLLSQSVYAAYCCSFPDSYRMFDEDFKEDMVGLLYEWVAGCRPAPRIWMSWNFEQLEPPGLKQREKLIKQSKAKTNAGSSMSLDFVEMLGSSQMTGSESTLNQYGSVSSMSSMGGLNTGRINKKRRNTKGVKTSNHNINDLTVIQQVKTAQNEPSASKSETNRKKSTKSSTLVKPEGEERDKASLTTIKEFDENQDSITPKDSKASFGQVQRKPVRESHPIGKIAEFERGAFNTYGQSPLVAHFLHQKNLQVKAGLHARVQRTELCELPPLDAPTYRDLIQDSFKKVKETEKNYSKLAEKDKEEQAKFIRKQKQQTADFKKKEALLLSNRGEVKRISDLIMLELKKDQDSIGTGVSQEIDAALASLEC